MSYHASLIEPAWHTRLPVEPKKPIIETKHARYVVQVHKNDTIK